MTTYQHWRHPDWVAAHKARTAAYLALIDSGNEVRSLRAEDRANGTNKAHSYQHGPQQALRDDLGTAIDHEKAVEARLKAERPPLEDQ